MDALEPNVLFSAGGGAKFTVLSLMSLSADDLVVLVPDVQRDRAEAKAQEVLNMVYAWSWDTQTVLAPKI